MDAIGYWIRTCQKRKWLISKLELLVVNLAFQTFIKYQKITSVQIQMDNMAALTYLREIKGTKN